MRNLCVTRVLALFLGVSLAGITCARADHKPHVTKVKPKKTEKTNTQQSAEPDKVLYTRATESIKHSKYTEARLDLQTLINTYPDSEYLAKAKLAIADSFYKEGGTSNLTQAVDEYKNFIVFFPFLDEAQYAQMQVAMCHYRMMEKPDRDDSQAQSAEDEFRTFLLKYPQSPLVQRAEQNMRNVQEVLADGEYRIAYFYYKTKQDYRASAARLVELTSRYPLYSRSDIALYMLGDIYMRAKKASKNEDDKNHWGDLAAQCYSRIVKDYPMSKLAPGAKARLTSMGMPVPKSDPDAVARMQKQQLYEKEHHPSLVSTPMGMFKSSPDVHFAARLGQPNLNPPDNTVSATEVLNQGAAGPKFNVAAVALAPSGAAASQGTDTESVESSDSSSATPAATTGSDSPTTTPAAQIIDAPTAAPAGAGAGTEAGPTAASPSTMTALPTAPANAGAGAPGETPATSNSAAPASADSNSLAPTTAADPPAQSLQAVSSSSASSSNSMQSNQSSNSKDDSKNESSSKKKKGLHKIIP